MNEGGGGVGGVDTSINAFNASTNIGSNAAKLALPPPTPRSSLISLISMKLILS